MDRNEGDNMPIPIYQFIKDVEKRRIKGLEVLVDLDTLKTFYPAGMRLKNRPKKAMLVEDPRSRFNGEFWEVYPIATTPHKFTLFARSAKLSMHMGMQPGIMKDTGSRIVMVCTVMGIISLRMRLNIK